MKLLELDACPACGASQAGGSFDAGGGNLLRRCFQCETVYALEYADPFSEVYVDGYMFGEVGKFGLDVRDPLFQRYLLEVAHRRFGMIEKATGLRAATLLDVGSGTGEVLLAARERGWRGQGVEPERTGAAMAIDRGLEITVSLLEESGLPERSYDVVTAFHVLEHVPDSRSFLQTMARWAKPGGFVVVEVPNWASVQRRRFPEAWAGLRPREHLVHFTTATLPRAFRASGLEPVTVRSPLYLSRLQTLEQALWDLGRPHGRFRQMLEPLTTADVIDGEPVRRPTRTGWAVLRTTEAIQDRAGAGAVAFCVGRVPGR
jgi:2-polyprenyl-3-methyl-5-hydroxy-6-metoxy-1,4-benzoquinol methylase